MSTVNLYRVKNSINGLLIEIFSSHISTIKHCYENFNNNDVSVMLCDKLDGEVEAAEYFFQKPTDEKCFL